MINYQFLPCTKHSLRKERIASDRSQKIQDNTVPLSCNLGHFYFDKSTASSKVSVSPIHLYFNLAEEVPQPNWIFPSTTPCQGSWYKLLRRGFTLINWSTALKSRSTTLKISSKPLISHRQNRTWQKIRTVKLLPSVTVRILSAELGPLALWVARTPANSVALERSFGILKLLINKFRA